MTETRERRTIHGRRYESWPEHGAWYEVGHVDELGAWFMPMFVDGEPDADQAGIIEVEYGDA